MKFKKNNIISFIFFIITFFVCCGSSTSSLKYNEPFLIEPKELPGQLSKYRVYSDNWLSKAMDVARKLRILDFNDDLYFYLIKKNDLPEVLSDSYVIDTEELEILDAFYKQIGYLDKGSNLSDIMESGEENNSTAGFYKTGTNSFYLVQDTDYGDNPFKPVRFEDVVIIHELTHALQDMNFNLASLGEQYVKNTDGLMTFKALVEGDASLTHYLFCMNENYETAQLSESEKLEYIRRLSDKFASYGYGKTIKSDIPSFWVKGTTFVYLHGASFVSQLYLTGGFASVNNAFRNKMPVSTEQIMHPIKYIKNDVPVSISIPDLLDNFSDSKNNIEKVYEDTLGEYNIFILIEKHLDFMGANYPNIIAEGWDGDKLEFYMDSESDTYFLIWIISWDSEKDTKEFYDAYVSLVPAKTNNTVSLIEYNTNNTKWKTELDNIYTIEKIDNTVYIIENIKEEIYKDIFNLVLQAEINTITSSETTK